MANNGGSIFEAVPVSRRSVLKIGALGGAAAWAGFGFAPALSLPALAAQGEAGGRLVIGKPYEILSLDPHLSASQTSWEIQAVVYESLVFLDDALAPVPGLAESWETPDDRTYVFTIRRGVTFHNGREMTAEDVAFSLQRVLDPATASWWAVKMGPAVSPDAAAAAAAATAEALGTPAAGPQIGVTIEATGDYQVTARLSEPYAPFLAALSGTPTSIIPAQEVRDGTIDLERELVGTGPFRVAEHVEDERWVLAKHDGYWQPDRPLLQELVWQVMPDESSRVAALRTGEIQLTMFENPKMLDLLASDPNVEATQQVTTNYYILFVTGTNPQLEDARVRQAISLGIDREQIKDVALFGRATATGPIAAGFTQLAAPLSDVPFYTRDVERAKALLAEAGAGAGLALQLTVTPDLAATIPMAELIRAQLGEIGITVEIIQRDIATFVDEYSVQGTTQLAISWWAGYSDPYLILLELHSNAFAPILGLQDPAMDELIERAAREVDPTARLEVLRELERAVATTAYFQPLVTRDNFVAYRKDQVGGVTLAAAEGFGLPLWHRVQEMTRTA